MRHLGPVTLSQVKEALQELGGEADWPAIIEQVTKNRNGDYSHYHSYKSYKNTTFQVIQQHCEGYKKYKGPTHFQEVKHLRFRLTGPAAPMITLTPIAFDIEEPSQPERVKQEIYRILRDTALARRVKKARGHRCQICSQTLGLKDGKPYAETHHIKPLGVPHNGPDVRGNILCVCPNHHVLLDYGAIRLDAEQIEGVGSDYIGYHNRHIFEKA